MSLEEALEKRDELDEDFGSDLADASPQERKQALEACSRFSTPPTRS